MSLITSPRLNSRCGGEARVWVARANVAIVVVGRMVLVVELQWVLAVGGEVAVYSCDESFSI